MLRLSPTLTYFQGMPVNCVRKLWLLLVLNIWAGMRSMLLLLNNPCPRKWQSSNLKINWRLSSILDLNLLMSLGGPYRAGLMGTMADGFNNAWRLSNKRKQLINKPN